MLSFWVIRVIAHSQNKQQYFQANTVKDRKVFSYFTLGRLKIEHNQLDSLAPGPRTLMTLKYKDSIEYKALQRIKKMRGNVVLRQDLTDFGSYRQVSRVLKKLIDANELINLWGQGLNCESHKKY